MINELSQYTVFSTFDLCSACHQIILAPSESQYTGFETNGQLYTFTRIHFSVKMEWPRFNKLFFNLLKKKIQAIRMFT